ncbi:S-layer homology domain-containing protein [Rossellomorea sp. YZS02]|uniref:S-layer homology domain-containing protein n=1 Tax=Rossellomorea sp. YZS02 TaxID=3097358 RepID=UPI002A1330EC|nr:S-layer homology domain-containing protein [Rossellomorea sp. YZS02]MDX8343147.1 S-layer homology domain-containing protein [Rossellomorea sp. YZS02]
MKKMFCILLLGVLFVSSGGIGQAEGLSDIKEGDRFYEEIDFLLKKGVIQGFSDGEFKPGKVVKRQEAALMIGRALEYDGTSRNTIFSDVDKNNLGSGFIQSAYEKGVILGLEDGRFSPGQAVTRGDMANFISRAFKLENEALIKFTDVSISKNSYRAIRQIVGHGIGQGYSDDLFEPDKALTRGEFSAFLARALSDDFTLPIDSCGYDPSTHKNPNHQVMNCLLTQAALQSDANVPPEVLKAIATEESGWVHFKDNGETLIGHDGKGIGVMQVTSTEGYDVERLKNDISYNIRAGIEILKKKYNLSSLPKIGDHNPMNLESWYFAIMAYNGTVSANSPFYKETGDRNFGSYQDRVYANIHSNEDTVPKIENIPMTSEDFHYGDDTNNIIEFNKKNYSLKGNFTSSNYYYNANDEVQYSGKGLRKSPNTIGELIPLKPSDRLIILASPVYDTNNGYVWYPVKAPQTGAHGYIASPYIIPAN